MALNVEEGLEPVIGQTTHQGHPAHAAVQSARNGLGKAFKHGRAEKVQKPEILATLQLVVVGFLQDGISVDRAHSTLVADGIHQTREQ